MGTQQINLRLDKELVSQYQELADNADDRDRSYFMKKALNDFVSKRKPQKVEKKVDNSVVTVINHLNAVVGSRYQAKGKNADLIITK